MSRSAPNPSIAAIVLLFIVPVPLSLLRTYRTSAYDARAIVHACMHPGLALGQCAKPDCGFTRFFCAQKAREMERGSRPLPLTRKGEGKSRKTARLCSPSGVLSKCDLIIKFIDNIVICVYLNRVTIQITCPLRTDSLHYAIVMAYSDACNAVFACTLYSTVLTISTYKWSYIFHM